MLVNHWPENYNELWPHFTADEMACKCGCGALPGSDLMIMLETLRVRCNFPFPISSGARCPKHNDKESTTGLTGPHTTGLAVDIAVGRAEAQQLVEIACRMGGWYGIGVNGKGDKRFVHLDRIVPNVDENNPRPRLWSY